VSTPPIPSKPADLELIARLKNQLQYAELRIRVLEERLRLMRIENYGAGSEKLSHAQMEFVRTWTAMAVRSDCITKWRRYFSTRSSSSGIPSDPFLQSRIA
jgi:hypothetical protein